MLPDDYVVANHFCDQPFAWYKAEDRKLKREGRKKKKKKERDRCTIKSTENIDFCFSTDDWELILNFIWSQVFFFLMELTTFTFSRKH